MRAHYVISIILGTSGYEVTGNISFFMSIPSHVSEFANER